MATVACDIGDIVRLEAQFSTTAGLPTSPTTVSLRVIDPAGTALEPDPTPVNDNPGLYHYDLAITMSGLWRYRFAGTGAVVAAEEAKVFVRSSAFS